MGIRVNIDFDVDSIFNEEFKLDLEYEVRRAVMDEFKKQVREETVRIYQENHLDVSDAVLQEYKQAHAQFEASVKP